MCWSASCLEKLKGKLAFNRYVKAFDATIDKLSVAPTAGKRLLHIAFASTLHFLSFAFYFLYSLFCLPLHAALCLLLPHSFLSFYHSALCSFSPF
jgi:hypothetical protein